MQDGPRADGAHCRSADSVLLTVPCWSAQEKTYIMADEDAPVLKNRRVKKALGTPISWASGKDPTKKVR